ncbi:alpha-tubulin binding protein [Aureococcus anophagefferens]|nr:alpha-tubulin binding protein [Aureococcus anophagefferens]
MGLHEGVTVKHDALMGRTIVATRPFAPGEVIVSDTPVLVWDDPPDRGYPFLLRAFQRCDKATQKRILGMYHPALDRTSAMLEVRRKALELARTRTASPAARRASRRALYAAASLCCHDCRPNCRFRSHADGSLDYTCVRPIAAGQHVSFCYTGTPWWLTTRDRRERLRSRFDFFCRCERCVAPDPLRAARCPGCSAVVALAEPQTDAPRATFWECALRARARRRSASPRARGLRDDAHAALRHLEERFAIGQPPVSSAPDAAATRRAVDEFAWRAGQELSPSHYLAFRATAILANASMNLAHAKACYDGKGIPLRKCEPRADARLDHRDARHGPQAGVKQSLRVQHGYMLVRSGVPLRPITAPAPGSVALSRSTSFAGRDAGDFNDLYGRYSITSQQRDRLNSAHHLPYGEESKMPNFLKYDRKVLCFKAYYEEKVNESTLERQRVRKCLIYYYLENDTMQMVEPTEENSGIPRARSSGATASRSPGSATFYSAEDLYVGAELEVYKKRIKIYDCDEFTKQFLDQASPQIDAADATLDAATVMTGVDGEPSTASFGTKTEAMPCPEGEYNKMLRAKMQRETGADLTVKRNRRMHPMKQFMEAQLGKPQSQADLGSFLAHDRKVLRFDCVWDDSARLYGDVLKFKLHYFLSDDTIEILQVHEKNNGRDPVPKLLSRRRLPLPQEQDKTEYYHWRDLVLGKPVVVFNRNLLLIDADPYTVDHYNAVKPLGRPIAVDASRFRDDLVQTPVPPFNGFGPEDSLRSVYSIRPKKPTRDLSKSENCGNVMRFSIKMANARDEDKQRIFTLQYYLIDDTMAIREPPLRNSGHIGGNFLSRSRVRKPEDLHVGNEIEFLGHKFTIYEADEYTLRYMEAQGAPLPKSDLFVVVNKFAAMTKLSDAFEVCPPTLGGATSSTASRCPRGVPIDLQESRAARARRRVGAPCETGPVDKAALAALMQL